MYNCKFRVLLLILVGILPAACRADPPAFECSDAIGCVDVAPGAALELGVLQALSGGAAHIGRDQARSVELALDGRGRQFFGHPIELQVVDEQCTSAGGTVAALRISADSQVVAVLGPTCSSAAVTAGKMLSEAGLVLVSGATTAASLTASGAQRGVNWQAGYLRTAPNDAVKGQAAAEFVYQQLGVTRAATLNDGDVFTRGLTEAFEQTFTALGGEIVLTAVINRGDEDMLPVMTAVQTFEAELLFHSLFPAETELVVRQARSMAGLQDLPIVCGGGLLGTVVEALGALGVGLYFVEPATPESAVQDELRAAYEARYGEAPAPEGYVFGYDAANMLLDAIEAVALQEDDGTLHIGRQALRDALYATRDWAGVTGKLTCDEFGDCGNARFSIYRLDDPAAGIEGLLSNVIYTTPGQ